MSGTILLADDSLTIQKVVELTFADTDYRVVAVSSGDELLDKLGSTGPDLIICDVIMPGKDGYEVCQKIKSSPSWLHLPVILLTGTFEPFDRDRAIAAGCSEIITKPFEARKLVDTVERLIGGSSHQVPTAVESDTGPAVKVPVEEVTPPPIEAPVAETPAPETVEEFGTQLSEAAPEKTDTEEDGIEFTTSGFAEMEAAGQTEDAVPEGDSDDGLDFEFGDGSEEFGDAAVEVKPPEVPDLSAQTIRIEIPPAVEEPSPEVEPPTEEAVDAEPEPTDETPAVSNAVPEQDEGGDTEDGFQDEPSMADTSPVDPPDEESTGPVEAPPEESTAPVEAPPEESTSPVEPPPEESTAPVEPPAETDEGRLSDDEVDRIARRVLELASDRLEQIAWEVVPDMAEIVVRQRVRELEAEAEDQAPETVQ